MEAKFKGGEYQETSVFRFPVSSLSRRHSSGRWSTDTQGRSARGRSGRSDWHLLLL